MNASPAHCSQALTDAFEAFNEMSLQLAQSYRELEQRVAQLNAELAAARHERVQQLAEKERLAERLATLLEALPAGVLVLDEVERVREFNRRALDQLGEPLRDQPWASVHTRVFPYPPSAAGEATTRDGVRLHIASRALDSEPGRILVLQDITDAHVQQEQLNRQQRLAAMGEMAASLAHQIRTPLTAAVLYGSHLGKDQLPAGERARFAARLAERLKHLERLVNDMLAFARGGRGGADCFTVRELLRDLQASIETQLQASGAQCRIDDQAAGAPLLGNKDALISALGNLVANSLQVVPQAAVVEISARVTDAGWIELRLRDNGPGIPDDARPRLFEPFFTTRPGGTGLGLAVVQATVRAHRGTVHAEAPAVGGAEFVLRLPTAVAVAALPDGDCLNYLTAAASSRHAVYGIN